MTRDLKSKDNPIQSGKPWDKWIRLLLHSARRQQQDQVTERKYDLDPVGRCSQHVSKIRSRTGTAKLIPRTIPSKQVRVAYQQSRTTQMSNPDGSRLHPYVNPPAAPPPGSPAPGQSRGGARSRETVELPGSNNGRRFGPSLSSLAATVAVNLLAVGTWGSCAAVPSRGCWETWPSDQNPSGSSDSGRTARVCFGGARSSASATATQVGGRGRRPPSW